MRGKKCAVLLLLTVCAWCRGEAQVVAVSGSNVTFTAPVTAQPSEISWLKDEIKIVDDEEGKEPDFYSHYKIQHRVITNLMEKTFTLMNVTPGDSGLYKAVPVVSGKVTSINFRLQVFDPVGNVSIRSRAVENNVTLRCSSDSSISADPLKYEWRNVSHRVSDQQDITVFRTQKLQTFQCIVSNAVSSSNATITVPEQPVKRHHIITIVLIPLYILIAIVLCVLCRDTEEPSTKEETQNLKPKMETGALDHAVNKETENLENGHSEGLGYKTISRSLIIPGENQMERTWYHNKPAKRGHPPNPQPGQGGH